MQYRFDKHSILDILLPFFFVVCILSIQTFHWSTHKTVWQDYRVLFTPCTKDISKVIQLLTKAGVTGAISAESVEERFFSDDVHIPCFTQQEQYLQNHYSSAQRKKQLQLIQTLALTLLY